MEFKSKQRTLFTSSFYILFYLINFDCLFSFRYLICGNSVGSGFIYSACSCIVKLQHVDKMWEMDGVKTDKTILTPSVGQRGS